MGNLILLSSVAATMGSLGGPFLYYFYPAGGGGGGGGLVAKDAVGDDVTFKGWLETHGAGERKLVQGLKGDATYLIVTDDKKIESYGLNAVCTHLGCVVPWNKAENKFMCPCHGSQYNDQGKVVRGPAPLSLALAHVNDQEGKISLSTWTRRTSAPASSHGGTRKRNKNHLEQLRPSGRPASVPGAFEATGGDHESEEWCRAG